MIDPDPQRLTELFVALGLSVSVFASTAAAAFSYVNAKVKELQESRN